MRYSAMRAVVLGAGLLLIVAAAAAFADDTGTALHDLTQAAERGNPTAQYELGVAYANGDGVAADYNQAARWFAEAGRGGNADARRQLAFMTQLGLIAPSSAAADPDSLYRVQVASVANEADGAREWRRLQRLHPEALGNLTMAVEEFSAPTGDRLFQVEGGPLDEDGARAICGKLHAEGVGCRIVRPAP
jgi:TPR repeat protein